MINMNIREAVIADAKAIRAIYAPYVEQTSVTFVMMLLGFAACLSK